MRCPACRIGELTTKPRTTIPQSPLPTVLFCPMEKDSDKCVMEKLDMVHQCSDCDCLFCHHYMSKQADDLATSFGNIYT